MNLRVWAPVPILVVLVMASAIYLVNTRYQSRVLFIKSEQLLLQAQELDIAWRHLQSDRAELTRNSRIDRLAREQLNLAPTELSRTHYIQGKPSALPPMEAQP